MEVLLTQLFVHTLVSFSLWSLDKCQCIRGKTTQRAISPERRMKWTWGSCDESSQRLTIVQHTVLTTDNQMPVEAHSKAWAHQPLSSLQFSATGIKRYFASNCEPLQAQYEQQWPDHVLSNSLDKGGIVCGLESTHTNSINIFLNIFLGRGLNDCAQKTQNVRKKAILEHLSYFSKKNKGFIW